MAKRWVYASEGDADTTKVEFVCGNLQVPGKIFWQK